ncbi:ester cyclase [Pseudonocardia kujensis]|uniref:ester cyclase n=1 Tax=Pseudonocardia kujensis TaxID=1128675 RepID=UPI001E3C5A1E|nr:ester cyclase [Pseudonocardia kujensis]MCE0763093.1 ester cyclase [Pseudonocardia kujensis]
MDDLQLIRSELTAWNDKDLDGWLALYSEKSVFDVPGGIRFEGLDGGRLFWGGYQNAFPDNRVVERRLFGQDGQVLFEGVFEGTHSGPLPTPDGQMVEPTNRPVRVPFSLIYLVENGVIVGHSLYFDQLDMLTQLGLLS